MSTSCNVIPDVLNQTKIDRISVMDLGAFATTTIRFTYVGGTLIGVLPLIEYLY